MMSSAAHAVDHVKEITEGPASAVASPKDRSIHDGRVRHPAAGEQAVPFPPHGHERLFFDKEITEAALGQLGLLGAEAFDVKLLGHHRLDGSAIDTHPGEFQKRLKLSRPEGTLGRIAPRLLAEGG